MTRGPTDTERGTDSPQDHTHLQLIQVLGAGEERRRGGEEERRRGGEEDKRRETNNMRG